MTNQAQLVRILEWTWVTFGAYWLIVSRRGKAAQTSESPVYRILRLLLLVITFTLLFEQWTAVGFLGRNFLPRTQSLSYSGFGLALAGLAIAMWARISLGEYWSDQIALKVDHQLVRTGPYARMRHPIYSGVLLGVAGGALLVDEWRGVLAFLLLLTNYIVKAKREDKILSGAFPTEFTSHKKSAGFLLPRLYSKK